MNVISAVLSAISIFAVLTACGPGERFICRTAADYDPPAGGTGTAARGLGTIKVEKPEIKCFLPEGFDKARAEELVSGLLEKDLLSAGLFDGAADEDTRPGGVKIYPSLESLAIATKDGLGRLTEISVKIRVYRGGVLLLERTYSRNWSGGEAPDYERAWTEILPSAMLEIRRDIVSSLSRSF